MSLPVRALVIDFHDSYTYNLVDLITLTMGCAPLVIQHDDEKSLQTLRFSGSGDKLHFDCVVLSPGPGSCDDDQYKLARRFIQDLSNGHHYRKPVFGVCLGHQMLLYLLGVKCERLTPAHGLIHNVKVVPRVNPDDEVEVVT